MAVDFFSFFFLKEHVINYAAVLLLASVVRSSAKQLLIPLLDVSSTTTFNHLSRRIALNFLQKMSKTGGEI